MGDGSGAGTLHTPAPALCRNPQLSQAPLGAALGHAPGSLYLCTPWSLSHSKSLPDTPPSSVHHREPRMTQHRGHSHPLRGHHTPDSLRGRGHTGVCLRSSRGDRTDGTCPCTGRTQAYTLGGGGGNGKLALGHRREGFIPSTLTPPTWVLTCVRPKPTLPGRTPHVSKLGERRPHRGA